MAGEQASAEERVARRADATRRLRLLDIAAESLRKDVWLSDLDIDAAGSVVGSTSVESLSGWVIHRAFETADGVDALRDPSAENLATRVRVPLDWATRDGYAMSIEQPAHTHTYHRDGTIVRDLHVRTVRELGRVGLVTDMQAEALIDRLQDLPWDRYAMNAMEEDEEKTVVELLSEDGLCEWVLRRLDELGELSEISERGQATAVKVIIDPAAVATVFRRKDEALESIDPAAWQLSIDTVVPQLAYSLTRGPKGRSGTDSDRKQLDRAVRAVEDVGQLYGLLSESQGLAGFVGSALLAAMCLGGQATSDAFCTEAERLRPRWPETFRAAFRGYGGSGRAPLLVDSLRTCAQALRNTLGDGDLPGTHSRAVAALDFLEFMAAEADSQARHRPTVKGWALRYQLADLDSEDLRELRYRLDQNVDAARQQFSEWRERAG